MIISGIPIIISSKYFNLYFDSIISNSRLDSMRSYTTSMNFHSKFSLDIFRCVASLLANLFLVHSLTYYVTLIIVTSVFTVLFASGVQDVPFIYFCSPRRLPLVALPSHLSSPLLPLPPSSIPFPALNP